MKIIYELNGNVHVINPNTKCGLTVEQIAVKDVPTGVSFEIVNDSVIPSSREYRYAWKLNGDKIEIDQNKVSKKLLDEKKASDNQSFILSKMNITKSELDEVLSG